MAKTETNNAPDLVVTMIVMIMTAMGLVMVYSSSSLMNAGGEAQMTASFFKRSLLFALLGAGGFFVASRTPPEWLRKGAYPALLGSIVLLCLVWVPPLGISANGASRWVRFGPLGFQPSELAKLAVVLFLAHSIAKRGPRKVKKLIFGFMPHIVLPGIPIMLVLMEPDLGTAAVLVALVAAMSFVGGVRLRHLAVTAVPVVAGLGCMIIFVPFRMRRLMAFLDPWEHSTDSGFQLVQSFLAFGAGGVWGVGLGAGKQKLHYLPEAHTDFILSIWAEECGLVGVLVVLGLFSALVYRGYAIALAQEDMYRRLLATGITTWLGLQAALNALVVMGCLPTKGLPFPFLSYGGTGLVITLTAAGILAGLGRKEDACVS